MGAVDEIAEPILPQVIGVGGDTQLIDVLPGVVADRDGANDGASGGFSTVIENAPGNDGARKEAEFDGPQRSGGPAEDPQEFGCSVGVTEEARVPGREPIVAGFEVIEMEAALGIGKGVLLSREVGFIPYPDPDVGDGLGGEGIEGSAFEGGFGGGGLGEGEEREERARES
jgi:hypothetical protein